MGTTRRSPVAWSRISTGVRSPGQMRAYSAPPAWSLTSASFARAAAILLVATRRSFSAVFVGLGPAKTASALTRRAAISSSSAAAASRYAARDTSLVSCSSGAVEPMKALRIAFGTPLIQLPFFRVQAAISTNALMSMWPP